MRYYKNRALLPPSPPFFSLQAASLSGSLYLMLYLAYLMLYLAYMLLYLAYLMLYWLYWPYWAQSHDLSASCPREAHVAGKKRGGSGGGSYTGS